ncbi:MAG: trigger factor [Hyphomicrobiales bacterium]|nr:trigger factor [Hyphomicrobiales bacterium]
MQVNETLNDGLARELTITVAKNDMETQLVERLTKMKDQVHLNGFRQGKVPISHLRKVYGKQTMAEIVNEFINTRSGEILKERGEKPAQQPQVSMTEDEKEAEAILGGEKDFEFKLVYEVLPEFEVPALDKLVLERPVVEVGDKEIEEQALQAAESTRSWDEKKSKAARKDRITMDYLGKIDGEAFEGGEDKDAKLVLGSEQFIPGFEDQLIGSKAGDELTVKVSFPEEYGAEHLAGKNAEFDVKVSLIEKPSKLELNDETAKLLGLDDKKKLLEVVREQLESRYGSFTRARVKRQILDQLNESTEMEMPTQMVEQEFDNIWNQVTQELEKNKKTFEDEDTTEEDARKEYRELAERRVRLGLVLATIGEQQEIQVSEEELQKAVYDQMRQYPGQEQQIMEYFQKTPDAVAGLRAPLYEEKVVDHIMGVAEISDKTVSVEELTKEDDE